MKNAMKEMLKVLDVRIERMVQMNEEQKTRMKKKGSECITIPS